MGDGVRTRPHQRHLARQDIEQLRQFVEAGDPQNSADARDARVATVCLHDLRAVLQHVHGAEFVDIENLAMLADAALVEDGRPLGIEHHHHGNECQQGQRQQKRDQRQRDVEHALDGNAFQRRRGIDTVGGRKNGGQRRERTILNAHGQPWGRGYSERVCRFEARKEAGYRPIPAQNGPFRDAEERGPPILGLTPRNYPERNPDGPGLEGPRKS